MFKKFFLLILALTLLAGLPQARAMNKPFDHSLWDQCLKKFVNDRGEVDFASLKADPALLDNYLKQIDGVSATDLSKAWPREERFAFWLNVFHAGIFKAVIDYYPVKSIQDIPGIWDITMIHLGPKNAFSLNQIRQDKLLGEFRDEKIHTALYSGAASGPRLMREAFTGDRVEGQLFLAAQNFVNDPGYNKIVPGEKKIWLSRIFKWYARDFRLDFGAAENDRGLSPQEYAILSFVAHYAQDLEKIEYLQDANYKIKYFDFDWRLNEWHSAEKSSPKSA